MPYIKVARRVELDHQIDLLQVRISDLGELNYVVTRLALGLLRHLGFNYGNAASVFGTVNEAVHEMRRRLLAPYEDTKMSQQGDVLEYEELLRK